MLLKRAEEVEGKLLPLDDGARDVLIGMSDGDARVALTLAEEVWSVARSGEILDAGALQKLSSVVHPFMIKDEMGTIISFQRCINLFVALILMRRFII